MEIVKSVFQSKSKRYQFIRYCTVGTLAAGIHYGVYYLLQEYEMTNLNIAYTIGYVTSFICNFFLTSYFTFRSNPSLKRALGFGGSHLVNYLIHMGLFNLFLYLNVDQEIAPLCVLAVAVLTNFLMLRFVLNIRRNRLLIKSQNRLSGYYFLPKSAGISPHALVSHLRIRVV